MTTNKAFVTLLVCASLAFSAACSGGDEPIDDVELEVITTVQLTFTPMAGGDARTFEFSDDDGDGGNPPVGETIGLLPGDFMMTVAFSNRLEDPPEDITQEVADEAQDHQVFFTGTGVDGPANANPGAPLTHSYNDQDANGLPIGLDNLITAVSGTGELTVTLRHMPPVNEQAVKVADMAGQVATEGFESIGGDNDVQVTLPVEVQ